MPKRLVTDVLVVGCGISGALVARGLAVDGWRVALVDRRAPISGSTLASTALLQFELDTPLSILTRRMGASLARRAWLRSHAALRQLHQLVLQPRLRVPFAVRPSVYLSGESLEPAAMRSELRARLRAGLPSTGFERAALARRFNLRAEFAIVSEGNLELNPRQLSDRVLRDALRHGARIYSPHEVTAVHSTRNSVTAATNDGHEIRAAYVVFCTGYEVPKFLPPCGHRFTTTWAIATAKLPRAWPERALIWEAREPYHYARTTSDGRVICGGEDEPMSSDKARVLAIPRKQQRLERQLAKWLPDANVSAEFAWCGVFGTTDTGLPIIGPVANRPRCMVALGYGGNGITFSMLAAELIANRLRGAKDPDAALFAPRR